MNIFATHVNPQLCAIALDDRRLVKMVLETAQLLSTAVREPLPPWAVQYEADKLGLYRATHRNHPCSKWARAAQGNFSWLVLHGYALAREYSFRFHRTHASEKIFHQVEDLFWMFPPGGRTEFANVTQFPDLPPTEAYKRALVAKWCLDGTAAQWTGRDRPHWAHLYAVNVAPAPDAHP